MKMHKRSRAWLGWSGSLLLAGSLAACGGGNQDEEDGGSVVPPVVSDEAGRKVLVLDIDGVSYAVLAQALANGEATGLAGLQVGPAWTGGRAGAVSEQMTAGRPSWATLLTGQWADTHGISWEQAQHERLAQTVFTLSRQALPDMRSGVAASGKDYLALLGDAATAGVDAVGACDAVELPADCVVTEVSGWLAEGYDLSVAQLGLAGQPAAAALAQMTQVLDKVRAALAERQARFPKEEWLLLVTSGYGTDRYGSATGAQDVGNKTVYIAASTPLAALGQSGAAQPASLAELYRQASLADVAPTVLRHLEVPLAVADYRYDGQALQASPAIRAMEAVAGEDQASIELAWELTPAPAAAQVLLRDGEQIANLPLDARSYIDDALPAETDGVHTYRYTLAAGDAVTTWPARIDYVKPMVLAPTLTTGLSSYYSFNGTAPVDALGASSLSPWDAAADGGTSIDADNFLGKWLSAAWRIDTTVVGSNGVAGYKLRANSGDITDNRQFTVGFWFRTPDLCALNLGNGVPIYSNKNWNSGGNAGITIGLWNGCEVRFNLGGSGRIDSTGNAASAGQWAYMALAVDRDARTFTSYVFDAVKGVQVQQLTFSDALGAKVAGLGQGFSLAEDGTGRYITSENSSGSPRGTMEFNDLALWTRVVTRDELTSIYRSGRPLSSLLP